MVQEEAKLRRACNQVRILDEVEEGREKEKRQRISRKRRLEEWSRKLEEGKTRDLGAKKDRKI